MPDDNGQTVTNEAFLRGVFGERADEAHVCGFIGDPGRREDVRWMGDKWGRMSQDTRDRLAKMNAYFCISRFEDEPETGRAVRRRGLFRACHAIVVDDVGTKIAVDDPRLLPPSWRLETSPDNWQYGYILRPPVTSRPRVEALLDGIVRRLALTGVDPGMKGVTRYARLPQSVNGKAKWGPGGFQITLSPGAWRGGGPGGLE